MILVTGATGTTGRAVLRHLAAAGLPTRALVHNPAKLGDLPEGVEGVVGSFESPPQGAFDGVDAVFLVSPVSDQQVAQENSLVDALAAAGRAHIVKLVAAGIEQRPAPVRFNANHHEILDHIATTGLPLTVLAPNSFMDNVLFSAETIRTQGAIYNSAGEGAVSFIAADDIGSVAAHVLSDPAPHAGATYTLTGPEALTYAQVATLVSAATGREVRHVSLEPDQARVGMVVAGVPAWNADGLVELDALISQGYTAATTDEVVKATGGPATSFEDWLRDHAGDFTS